MPTSVPLLLHDDVSLQQKSGLARVPQPPLAARAAARAKGGGGGDAGVPHRADRRYHTASAWRGVLAITAIARRGSLAAES
jgi:type II secretory pathway component PulK